jgi:protease-4
VPWMPPSDQPPRRPPPPPPPRPSRKWLWIVMGILGAGVLFMGGLFLLVILAVFSAGSDIQHGGPPVLNEEVVSGHGVNKIAQIELSGIILPQQLSLFGSNANIVERVKNQLRQATSDPSVVAILLVVDSPGGGVTASDELWNEVKKAKGKKKVIVHMGNLCASGGYYVSAPADHIVASPTTVTGSIGVIMSLLDASSLMQDKLGVKENNITSGPYKDIGSMARPMKPEERAIMQAVVDDMYGRFVKIVAEGRAGKGPIPAEAKAAEAAVRTIADGRIYTATQALSNGLVDEIGYLEDAQKAARKIAGVSDAEIIRYRRKLSFMDIFSGDAEGKVNVNAGVQVDAGRVLPTGPQFLYLWSPGQ